MIDRAEGYFSGVRPGALIITAQLPPELQARAEALRRAHYPVELNRVPAHVTLIRALPPSVEAEAAGFLARIAASEPAPVARMLGVADLGSGTALRIESPGLDAVRDLIADHFHAMTGLADASPARLHITIQNKVTRKSARELQMKLGLVERGPAAFWQRGQGFRWAGLALWAYQDGPWSARGAWRFRK